MDKEKKSISPDFCFCSCQAFRSYLIDSISVAGFMAFILFLGCCVQIVSYKLYFLVFIHVSEDAFTTINALCVSYVAGYIVYFLTMVLVEWSKAIRCRRVVYSMLVNLNLEASQIIENTLDGNTNYSKVQFSEGTIIHASEISLYLSKVDCSQTINTYDGLNLNFLMAISDFCQRCHERCNHILSLYGTFLSKVEHDRLTEIVSSDIYGWFSFNEKSESINISDSKDKYTDLINMLTKYVSCLQNSLHISQGSNHTVSAINSQ